MSTGAWYSLSSSTAGCGIPDQILHRVIESLDEEELAEGVIVVALTDREKRLRDERAKILYRKFRSQVDSGMVIIVGPTSNIYPTTNFYTLKRRPFNNTVERMEWQAKLSLDFAFLFSFCSQLVSEKRVLK